MEIGEREPQWHTEESGLWLHRVAVFRYQLVDISAGREVPVGPFYKTKRAALAEINRYILAEGWKIEA